MLSRGLEQKKGYPIGMSIDLSLPEAGSPAIKRPAVRADGRHEIYFIRSSTFIPEAWSTWRKGS